MNSRTLLNIALVIAVVILGALAFYEPGLDKPPAPEKLTGLDPQQITRIIIERTGKDTIAVEHQEGAWRITQPISAPAGGYRMDSLARVSEAAIRAQFAADTTDLAQFGLAAPSLRLRLNDTELAFGGTDPVKGYRYVLSGTSVFLISDSYYHELVADLPAFVDHRLLLPQWKIASIDIPAMEIARAADGGWLVTPAQPGAAADAVAALVEEWGRAQATAVERYEGGAAGDEIRVHIEGQAEPLRFSIIEREPELILGREDIGMQYRFSADQAGRLLMLSAHEPPAEADGAGGAP